MESAVREHIRAELDERNRKRTGAGDNEGKNMGLAPRCFEATGGDPLLALLALNVEAIYGDDALATRCRSCNSRKGARRV